MAILVCAPAWRFGALLSFVAEFWRSAVKFLSAVKAKIGYPTVAEETCECRYPLPCDDGLLAPASRAI